MSNSGASTQMPPPRLDHDMMQLDSSLDSPCPATTPAVTPAAGSTTRSGNVDNRASMFKLAGAGNIDPVLLDHDAGGDRADLSPECAARQRRRPRLRSMQ